MTEIQALEQLWQRHDWVGYTGLGVFVVLEIWKRYGAAAWDAVPSVVRFAIPFLVVGGTGFYETIAKDPGATIVAAAIAGLSAALGLVGAYHGLKRAPVTRRLVNTRRRPPPAPPPPEDPKERDTDPPSVSAATIVLLGALAAGCQTAQDASDMIAGICQGRLAATPEVQTEARRKAVSPLVIAEAICALNDAGRYVWQLFSTTGPDGARTATPAPQLEAATARALLVARAQGVLP